MKKIYSTIILCVCLSICCKAQNIAVGIHSGVTTYLGGNTNISVPVGVNVEWAFNAVHSIAGRTDFGIGIGNQNPHIYYLSPEYKYYLVGETLDGFYLGGYFGIGGATSSAYLSIGGLAGYSLLIKDNWNFEANLQYGYGNFTGFGRSVFHLSPTLGFRYVF